MKPPTSLLVGILLKLLDFSPNQTRHSPFESCPQPRCNCECDCFIIGLQDPVLSGVGIVLAAALGFAFAAWWYKVAKVKEEFWVESHDSPRRKGRGVVVTPTR